MSRKTADLLPSLELNAAMQISKAEMSSQRTG
jgi:hypothetical protein